MVTKTAILFKIFIKEQINEQPKTKSTECKLNQREDTLIDTRIEIDIHSKTDEEVGGIRYKNVIK